MLTKPNARRRGRKPAPRKIRFWVRKPDEELDRAGDWLLKNLSAIRAEAVSRAHPR